MKKEIAEWVYSWCDNAPYNDLPRVLLVGDSITYGYEKFVREQLKGIAYVDYFATSYAVDSKIYSRLLKSYLADSHYDLIHFNHGLHGEHMSKKCYKNKISHILAELTKKYKIILATSTFVYQKGNEIPCPEWTDKVKERNQAIVELAKEYSCPIDDLYSVSVSIEKQKRKEDGTHYTEEGYQLFSESVVSAIKQILF